MVMLRWALTASAPAFDYCLRHFDFTITTQGVIMSDIQYRNLGRNGVKVSPITLGTMMFGGQTPDDVARRITDRVLEQGINSIDTANGYNGGFGRGGRSLDRRAPPAMGAGDQVRQSRPGR